MPRTLFVVLLCAATLWNVAALAQDETPPPPPTDEPTFNLKPTGGSDVSMTDDGTEWQEYEPILPRRELETSVTLGYWDLATTLMKHESIIYKYTPEHTYYGDVELNGESAFHPQLRLSFPLDNWLTLEGFFDISVSEYTSSISNPNRITNAEGGELEPVDELGEFDTERRSNITLGGGLNVLFYPRDYGNFGKGRFHPYLIGGVSRVGMSINSDYTDDATVQWRYSGGAGFRLIADDMISIRFEMLYNHMTFRFTPKAAFTELDDGTTQVPVYEYLEGQGAVVVEEYDEHTLNSMNWALGFTATF